MPINNVRSACVERERRGGRQSRRSLRRHRPLSICLALCLATLRLIDPSYASEQFHFDVPEGLALEQLLLLATQANNARIFLDPNLIGKSRTNAVHGTMDFDSALFLALRGTGFAFYTHSTGTIMLRRSTEASVGPQQATPRSGPPRTRAEGPSEAEHSNPRLEELVVLGTKMHHEVPVGAPTIRLTQEDLVDGGFANFDALIRSEPEVFLGGPGPVSRSVYPDSLSNSGFGSAINLRGFGAGSTLILVNHSRLAPSGSSGRFTDISNLPTIAIDHVDTITDGSSALYGADAVGGVVNFVTRDGNSVSDTLAHVASVTEGGYHEALLGQFVGLPWDERCLRFHENPRYVHTTSYDQVRRPIYTSSVGRWRRFAHQLSPLRQALGDSAPDSAATATTATESA